MEFNHLPVLGGIYDQHPELLAQWEVIFGIKSREDRRKADKKQKEMERKAKNK